MITALNNQNINLIFDRDLFCPICSRPMKEMYSEYSIHGVSSLDYFIYNCKSCFEQHNRTGSLHIEVGFLITPENNKEITLMEIGFTNLVVRQDHMDQDPVTIIYMLPTEEDGTLIEIIRFPMIEFDISDIEKFKQKIKTYAAFI